LPDSRIPRHLHHRRDARSTVGVRPRAGWDVGVAEESPRPVRRRLRPGLVVGVLIVVAGAAQVALAGDGSTPAGSAAALATIEHAPAPVAARSSDASPSPTPAGALGARPRLPAPELAEPTATPEPPAVVRFRPRDGWTDVSPWAAVSVRFTEPMDHASTEAAFAVVVGEKSVAGAVRWAENDTVLVLQPKAALPYGARVRLSVAAGASSRAGAALASAAAVSFTVAAKPAPPVPAAARATAKPAPVAASGWRWPLIGPITQRFGETLTKYGFHQGIDIDGATGDPVRAARTGTVTVAGHWDDCGGLQIHVDHGDGLSSWYRHLSRIDVAVGQRVAAGTVIGAVGETGCAFGSHLHFAIRRGSSFVDPLRYLPPR
jgi:murein DD-endopeptidase MepM/ murein hydrolase activator NlpD